ncbi:hypothetical protein DIPPA_34446 [Diplonema papillatum]|nr:hypothetical protein DIPPA_34446 [Diplonema papillatum]
MGSGRSRELSAAEKEDAGVRAPAWGPHGARVAPCGNGGGGGEGAAAPAADDAARSGAPDSPNGARGPRSGAGAANAAGARAQRPPASVANSGRKLYFYGKSGQHSYSLAKCEVIPATVTLAKQEATVRANIAALERAYGDAIAADHIESTTRPTPQPRTLNDSVVSDAPPPPPPSFHPHAVATPPTPPLCPVAPRAAAARRRVRGCEAVLKVLPQIFEFLPLHSVVRLRLVCRSWAGYLGKHGINYIVYHLRASFERHGTGKVPLRLSQDALRSLTMGVCWEEDGKALGATVQVCEKDMVKAALGSDVSGYGSSIAKYCEKYGQVEDADSEDLEVIFPDGARKWFAAKALRGSSLFRWIVRIPPGPHWLEVLVIEGAVHVETVLREAEKPDPHKLPWVLTPVWPVNGKRGGCEKVALMADGYSRYTREQGWQKESYRGMSDYTVMLGKPLLPDVLLGLAAKELKNAKQAKKEAQQASMVPSASTAST